MFIKTWASVFRLLKKSCWASSVSQNVPVSLGSVCALAITEGRGTIAGIWPYFITSHFGKAQSLFFWYYPRQFLTAEESTYCQRESSYITFLCLKNDLAVSRGCLKLPTEALVVQGILCMVTNCSVVVMEQSVIFPFCTLGRAVSVSGRQSSSGIAGGKTASCRRVSVFFSRRKLFP